MSDLNYQMVRYADDFVILCRTAEETQAALAEVQQWVTVNSLTLHPTKTEIVDSREQSLSFLGYSFRGHLRFPRAKSNAKLQDRLRDLPDTLPTDHRLDLLASRILLISCTFPLISGIGDSPRSLNLRVAFFASHTTKKSFLHIQGMRSPSIVSNLCSQQNMHSKQPLARFRTNQKHLND